MYGNLLQCSVGISAVLGQLFRASMWDVLGWFFNDRWKHQAWSVNTSSRALSLSFYTFPLLFVLSPFLFILVSVDGAGRVNNGAHSHSCSFLCSCAFVLIGWMLGWRNQYWYWLTAEHVRDMNKPPTAKAFLRAGENHENLLTCTPTSTPHHALEYYVKRQWRWTRYFRGSAVSSQALPPANQWAPWRTQHCSYRGPWVELWNYCHNTNYVDFLDTQWSSTWYTVSQI